ncbi:MAG: alpha-hydroxy-acid oxidizing protein [Gammaproteobacteria bacterium]|nr:alpha-hydroxy-acid oxidizing protein [Gammaproteobacteria bacterium]
MAKREQLTRRAVLGSLGALPFLSWARAADTPPPSLLYQREAAPLTAAGQVPNVMGFEPLARRALPPAHYAYLATGVDDDHTVVRNQEAFGHYQIRARRFADRRHLDLTREVFGARWPMPLYLSCVSSMGAFHPEGELAVARAAHSRGVQMMLASGSSVAVRPVLDACGGPLWMQLYPTDDWAVTEELVRRYTDAGVSAIVLTLDNLGRRRNNETLFSAMARDSRPCASCHVNNSHDMWRRGPIFTGIDTSRVTQLEPDEQTLQFFDRLRAQVKVRLIAKGIVTGEDAALAVQHGADAVIVSNHGGRDEETLRASIDCLPEVVAAVRGRVPVFVDGGFRRGTDVFKALALGASAIGVGRPHAWGLSAFGQDGVEAVIDIYARELDAIMRQAGTVNTGEIGAASVLRA